MVGLWLLLGLFGWASLMGYRLALDGLPKHDLMSYLRGFLLAVLLGPLCFALLGFWLITRKHNDKTSDKQ